MSTDINEEWLPTTPLQVRAFVGANFVSASVNPETGEGQYVMTEHDLLQAFAELRDTASEYVLDDRNDARRWRAVCTRHGVSMTRMATGSASYSSHKKQAILDAWADMAAAEVEGFDHEAAHAELQDLIAESLIGDTQQDEDQ